VWTEHSRPSEEPSFWDSNRGGNKVDEVISRKRNGNQWSSVVLSLEKSKCREKLSVSNLYNGRCLVSGVDWSERRTCGFGIYGDHDFHSHNWQCNIQYSNRVLRDLALRTVPGTPANGHTKKKLTSILRCRIVHHALLRTVDPRAWHTKVCGAM
jgi:hypothetical protein